MRDLVFALEFKGTAVPVPGASNRLRARTSASDQILRTTLKGDGVQTGIDRSGSEAATFESEVEIVADGAFVESGSIAYGAAGGQTVPHFHLHVLPRYAKDGVTVAWPRPNPPADELAALAGRIRSS